MTTRLKEAFQKAEQLPDDQQDALANVLLDELEGDARWRELFSGSADALATLADEAIAEDGRGDTVDLDESL